MAPDGPFMSDSDAFSWYMEKDPQLRSTVVAVAWLDAAPPWQLLHDRLERATRLAPSFRRRPLEPPARLAPPRWATDPDFHLDWHLRRLAAPEPYTTDVVLDVARVSAMSAFDLTRPLWEFTVVEGLVGGQAALIMKLHHSLTDGIGGVALAQLLVDVSQEGSELTDAAAPRGERLSTTRLAAQAALHTGRRLVSSGASVIRSAPVGALMWARHPGSVTAQVLETVRSVGRTVKPLRRTLSPLVTARGPGRRLHMLTVGMSELKMAGRAGGGTLNDAFVAGVAGGLRRYHEQHGARVGDLLMTLPISLRSPGDPIGGNRITLLRLPVPAGDTDPMSRIAEVHGRCLRARHERSLPYTQLIAGVLNLMPPAAVGSMLKHVDFVASDVPGFPDQAYLCGVPITGFYPFGPTIGAAVNATLFSYMSKCCIGVTVDTDAVADDDVLLECLAAGFAEVTGRKPEPPVPHLVREKEFTPC